MHRTHYEQVQFIYPIKRKKWLHLFKLSQRRHIFPNDWFCLHRGLMDKRI